MLCFKGNLGSAKGVQLTAQESKKDSPSSFTETTQPQHSLAGFYLHARWKESRGEAEENFNLPSQSGSDLSDEHPHRDQAVTKQRGTTDWGNFLKKEASSDK